MAAITKTALALILCVTAADAFSPSLSSLNSVTRSQRASTGVLATSMKGGKKRKAIKKFFTETLLRKKPEAAAATPATTSSTPQASPAATSAKSVTAPAAVAAPIDDAPPSDWAKKFDALRDSRQQSMTQRFGGDFKVPTPSFPPSVEEKEEAFPSSSSSSSSSSPQAPQDGAAPVPDVDYVQHALDVRDADELFAAAERAQSDGRTLDAAECLVSFLRIKTDGNLLRVVGTSDTAENKELWAKHAPVASKLAGEAGAAEPTSVKAKALYAEARTMQAASKGIVKVATSGELPELQRAVKELREMDPTWDLGMAWVFAGSNYLALPWPLGSASKAQDRFKEALKVNEGSSRNLYFAAMAERALGNKEKAFIFFDMAAKAASNPLSDSERDVSAFLKEQSEAGSEEARGG